MKVIERATLMELIAALKGSTVVTFDYRSTKKRGKQFKAAAPWEYLTHLSRINGMFNVDYENAVNRQRWREDKPDGFEAEARSYGERVGSTLVHGGNVMLPVKVERYLSSQWLDPDGNEIPADDVKPWLYKKSSRQGVDKRVDWKNFSIASMGPYFAIGGEELSISDIAGAAS